jgi:hypothetical protein
MVLVPSVPTTYHAILFGPNVALASAMACRVFRGLRTGVIDDNITFKFDELETSRKTSFTESLSTSRRIRNVEEMNCKGRAASKDGKMERLLIS